ELREPQRLGEPPGRVDGEYDGTAAMHLGGAQRQRRRGGGLSDPTRAGTDDDLHPRVGQDPDHVQREGSSHTPERPRRGGRGRPPAAPIPHPADRPARTPPRRSTGTGPRPVRPTAAPRRGSPARPGLVPRAAAAARPLAGQARRAPTAGLPPAAPGPGTHSPPPRGRRPWPGPRAVPRS